jgi:hypothetical protein
MGTIFYKWFLYSCLLFSSGLLTKGEIRDFEKEGTIGPSGLFHPFYISITELSYNAKDKTIEISCKMFAEDLEETLKKNYKAPVDLSLAKDKPALDKFIPDYINRHFSLSVDGKAVKLNYIGYEKDKESAYCYFQVDNVPVIKKIDINTSLLHDFNEEQINIVHVMVNGKRQSVKLDYPSKEAGFNF